MAGKAYRVGGTRGGASQFQWEDVKLDKQRELYLGHSIQAPVGRWQKGKDLKWWSKKGSEPSMAEKAAIRAQDEDMINEALGLAPKRAKAVTGLDDAEMKQALARGETERDFTDIERVSGLGAAPAKGHDHMPHLTLKERELERRARQAETEKNLLKEDDIVRVVSVEEEKEARRKEKKAVKKEKKAAKKELKRAKKEKKRERKEKAVAGTSDDERGEQLSKKRRVEGNSESDKQPEGENLLRYREGGRRRERRSSSREDSRDRRRRRDRERPASRERREEGEHGGRKDEREHGRRGDGRQRERDRPRDHWRRDGGEQRSPRGSVGYRRDYRSRSGSRQGSRR
ncbi:unnamed protein product [Chrysoparadoxa australica]